MDQSINRGIAGWQEVNARRRQALGRKQSGTVLAADERALTRFTVADLFSEPEASASASPPFLPETKRKPLPA